MKTVTGDILSEKPILGERLVSNGYCNVYNIRDYG